VVCAVTQVGGGFKGTASGSGSHKTRHTAMHETHHAATVPSAPASTSRRGARTKSPRRGADIVEEVGGAGKLEFYDGAGKLEFYDGVEWRCGH